MSEVERAGLGMAAFPGEDHLGVDEVETAGGDQEGIVAQREAVVEEGTICVCSPAQGPLGTGVSNKVSSRFEGVLGQVLLEVLMGSSGIRG